MKAKPLILILVAGVALSAAFTADSPSSKSHKLTTVSMRKMTDSLHAVIAADRQAYAELIVQRLRADPEHRVPVTEDWERAGGVPAPAQMLRHAAQDIQKHGAEFSYTLRSLWPISAGHGPQTDAEQAGLEAVAKNPAQPFYTEEELGGRSYFTAIYPDRATLPSCVSCHNNDPRSPKRDFKQGDVMGAIVVRVPLEF